jgi:hypothetical protein
MGTYIMKSNITRQRLIKEVQEEFTKAYPYLRIDLTKGKGESRPVPSAAPGRKDPSWPEYVPGQQEETDDIVRIVAQKLLFNEFGMSDDMKINELELLLQYEFGLPVQILRKSGNLWLETRMSQYWTLRQQNDHGHDIAHGYT